VPKHGNFELTFFTLNDPFWVGDSGIEAKNGFFYHSGPDFNGFKFLTAY
jgi:hypothetical protein